MNIELKNISPSHKLIYIDGEKRGSVFKEAHAGPNSLDGKSQRYVAWTGSFDHDGARLSIGATESIAAIAPKIERAISAHDAKKNTPVEEAAPIQSVRPTVAKEIEALLDAGDLAGLMKMRGSFVVKQEEQRMRFAKNRMPKNGEMYLRTGRELGKIKSAIRQLESKDRTDEEFYTEGLGDMIKSGISNAADRVRYGFGDEKAGGRLDLNAATKHLSKDWHNYLGRQQHVGNVGANPTIGDLADFLQFQYGIEMTDDEFAQIARSPTPKPNQPAPDQPNQPLDDKMRGYMKDLKTSAPKQYAAMKAKLQAQGKPTESVVMEAGVQDQTFDEKVLFPKLANFLIQQGVITVSGKKKDTKQTGRLDAKGNPIANDVSKDDAEAATSSSMTDDGHYIDSKKFSTLLDNAKIHADQMNALKEVLAKDNGAILHRIRQKPVVADALSLLIGAALGSINKTNANVQISPNVTASGNTMNLNVMKDMMEKAGVDGKALNKLRELSKAGTLDDEIKNNGTIFKLAVGLAKSIVGSIQPAAGAAKKGTANKGA